MTVWLVHPVEQDLSSAKQWGEFRTISDRYIYADQIRDDKRIPRENQDKLLKAADKFDPKTDYFLLIGDQLQLVAFAAVLADFHRSFMVLRYDRKAEGYVPVLIES